SVSTRWRAITRLGWMTCEERLRHDCAAVRPCGGALLRGFVVVRVVDAGAAPHCPAQRDSDHGGDCCAQRTGPQSRESEHCREREDDAVTTVPSRGVGHGLLAPLECVCEGRVLGCGVFLDFVQRPLLTITQHDPPPCLELAIRIVLRYWFQLLSYHDISPSSSVNRLGSRKCCPNPGRGGRHDGVGSRGPGNRACRATDETRLRSVGAVPFRNSAIS